MSYPQYTPAYNPYAPPPKKRGLKRMIFGGLGIVANAIGLVLVPVIGLMIGAVISAMGLLDLTVMPAEGGTLEVSPMNVGSVWAPVDEAADVTCDITGSGLDVEPAYDPADTATTELDGVTYVQVYSIYATESTEAAVHCDGSSSVATSTMGLLPTLIATGASFLIPIVLGILSLALLIWGIIARVRS